MSKFWSELQKRYNWSSLSVARIDQYIPLRLRSPVAVCRHLKLAEGVALDTVLLLLNTALCHEPLLNQGNVAAYAYHYDR